MVKNESKLYANGNANFVCHTERSLDRAQPADCGRLGAGGLECNDSGDADGGCEHGSSFGVGNATVELRDST